MDDDLGQCSGIGCEALAQSRHIGQPAGPTVVRQDSGEFRLAPALMGKREKIDH
jgi:hypothetical protein